MKSESGRSIYVDAAKHKASVHGALDCSTCHTGIKDYPHPKPMPRVSCASCHAQPPAEVAGSAHHKLGAQACASCHGPAHEIQRAATAAPQACAGCHGPIVRDYQSGVHATVRRAGDPAGATCQSCHGPAHKILRAHDPASPVAKKNLPDTCGSCHANPEFLARHNIPFAHPVEAYRLSVHGRAVAAGNPLAASCSDCHANHAIFPGRDSRSSINHWNVMETCGACHTAIKNIYQQSIHGQAVARSVPGAPICTDCHGEHNILAPSEPQSLVNRARVSRVTCGHCHSDERLAQRYNLPGDKVPSYADSYHGLALRSGAQTVANCASCHGVHNILPSSDPRSTIHPANLSKTCGNCHPGAGERFAIGPVHVRSATRSEHVVVRWIRVAYWILIPWTVAFIVLHNALDFLAKFVRGGASHVAAAAHAGEEITRMNLHFRVAHWLVVISFPILVYTGFALKFPESWWAQPLLRWEGRFGFRGTLHRTAAVVLVASLVYHLIHLIVSRRDRVLLRYMRPGIRDLFELFAVVRYNLGLSRERPTFGKINYAEKIEYLAFMWGTVVMSLSGFLLWFNNFTLRHFPKWVADAATAIHYYEAILAALSILLWHFYITIFDPDVYPMDRSWLTGRVPAEHLRVTRPAYYLELLLTEASRAARAAEQNASPARPPGETAPDPPPPETRSGTGQSAGLDEPEKPSAPDTPRKPPKVS
jgi:formate dehydrogenase gamma subunit